MASIKRSTAEVAVDKAMSELNGLYGSNTVMQMDGAHIPKVDVISSGSISLDQALGCWGYPRGRIVEIYGPECLDADTFVQYEIRTPDGQRVNHKGGTIERLWERFHRRPPSGDGRGKHRPVPEDAVFYAPSINEEGRIFQNRVENVIQAGEKECLLVQLKGGATITATAEHRFFVGGGYVALGLLGVGDRVYIHNGTPFRGAPTGERQLRPTMMVKHHPKAPIKRVYDAVVGKEYVYHRTNRSRIAWEARMNGLTFERYVARLNAGELGGLSFLEPAEHVHHKDEDYLNDEVSNLEVLTPEEHGRLHALERHNNLRFVVVQDEIVSVEPVGERETYDISMAAPANNFVANGVVVHNSSGKTTLALHAIANAQRAGGIAAVVDAEHALDMQYARNLGVDVQKLYLSQPDYGEQALEVVEGLVRSEHMALILVDSVAALTPKSEIDGDFGAAQMGSHARLMSQAMRKLTALAHKHNTLLIFINQIRMKIGVIFGCFSYGSRVTLADGGSMKIGQLVNQRLPLEVLSFNPETGQCEPRKITAWHDNGNADHFLQVIVEGVGGNGRATFGVTPNHMIFVPGAAGGWNERPAGELVPGDMVGQRALIQFTDVQRQLAVASVLGDGSIRKAGRHYTAMRFGHGPNQTDYARWKQEIMEGCVAWSGENASGGWSFDCRSSADMNAIHAEAYDGKDRRLSARVLQELTPFGVAVWAMDDGTFSGSYARWGHGKFEISAASYTHDERELMAARLEELGCGRPTVGGHGRLVWSGDRNKQLNDRIAQFVPPCMDYKLHPNSRGRYQEPPDEPQQDRYQLVATPIVDIYEKPQTRSMHKFDLTIEGHHTYLVDGVAVHNSPETTTGGNALKFYASVRLDVRRTGAVKEGGAAKTDKEVATVGNTTKVVVKKNKMAPPFREAEFNINFGRGIDKTADLLGMATQLGVTERAGAWYSYKNERLGQGFYNAVQALDDDPGRLADISKATYAKLTELP
jgi:recombination protein RecA